MVQVEYPFRTAVKESNMSRISTSVMRLRKGNQRGLAAVEFAIILPVMISLLAFPIFFGRVFMHYAVAQKAAHDAAVYLSNISMLEMNDPNRARAASDVAEGIVNAEIGELNPGKKGKPDVQVQCDGGPCGNVRPEEITVHVRIRMYDDYFGGFTYPIVDENGVYLRAQFTATYVGSY